MPQTNSVELSMAQARRLRRHSHLLAGSTLTPDEVVRRAVALQGQDLPAVLRAIVVRSAPGTSLNDVRAAFDSGELVRSWPMRGTLFATTPEWLATLLHFTSERTLRASSRRRESIGLDGSTLSRALDVLTNLLGDGGSTRSTVMAAMESAGISTADGRGYHLIVHHAVEGLVRWGRFAEGGREQLLELSPAPPDAALPADPDAALVDIVRGYITARAPVTEADLAWWTKLPRTVLRAAVAQVQDLVPADVAGQPMWVLESHVEHSALPAAGVDLIPGFDEWIMGYSDRSLVAGPEMMTALVPGKNGVFRPAVLLDGVAVGTWRRNPRSDEVVFTAAAELSESARKRIERAVAGWPHG